MADTRTHATQADWRATVPVPADTPVAKCSLPDWETKRCRSLAMWRGGGLGDYERPPGKPGKPANDNRPDTNKEKAA